jgi:hypothetical protein
MADDLPVGSHLEWLLSLVEAAFRVVDLRASSVAVFTRIFKQ